MATSLKQDLLRLRRLKDESARLNAQAKRKTAELQQFQARVFERMQAEEVESMKIDGSNFVPQSTEYASIQDREAFIEWAKENDTSLINYKEESRLLNQLVRERLDNGEELPPGIHFYTRDVVSVRAG